MNEFRSAGKTRLGSFFALITFATVLSQLPFFVSRGMASNISIAIWAVAAAVCFANGRVIRIRNIGTPIRIAVIILLFVFVAGMTNDVYWSSSIPRAVMIAMFVLFVGNVLGPYISLYDLKRILRSYAYATVVLAIDVYLEFFRGATFSRIYIYNEKNSTALLLFTGLIILLAELGEKRKKPGNSVKTAFNIVLCVILAYGTLILQCRAVYVSAAIVLVLFVISSGLNKRVKTLIVLTVFAAILYYLTHGQALDSFLDRFIYAGRSSTDLNDLSSGRTQEWSHFWTDLGDGFLFGNGRMKRESLVLTALLEFGFVFGVPILYLAVYPILFGIKNIDKNSSLYFLFIAVAIGFATNMLFEQLAPFGPGVKCFLLWFLLGIFASWKTGPYVRISDYEE